MDHRHFSRVSYHTKAELHSDQHTVKGEIEDLSLKGVFFRTPLSLKVGESVLLSVTIPGTSPAQTISIPGQVVRSTDKGMGLAFENLDYDVFCQLKNIVVHSRGEENSLIGELIDYRDETENPE